MEAGVSSLQTRNGGGGWTLKGFCVQEPHRVLLGFRRGRMEPRPSLVTPLFRSTGPGTATSCSPISQALRVMRVGFSEKPTLRWSLARKVFTKEGPWDPHLRKGEE